MEYGIRELSDLAGVSTRTLRYYDEIGLLKPSRTNEAGYRYYGEREVALLQQILFYRERGFELKQIQKMVYQETFDIMDALQDHLLELERQKTHVENLIMTVKQTILSMKGECRMSDKEKFQALKEQAVRENEEKYGQEIREKYGAQELEASNCRMLNMTETEWSHFQELERAIREQLEMGVQENIAPDSEEAKRIVQLHKEWLSMTWKQYTAKAHKGVAAMYVCDERFRKYYDKKTEGCAELLQKAIAFWADSLQTVPCEKNV